jgi:Flp pilus assembly protein TadG
MMALLAFLLVVVIAAAAFTIDIAYMQMVNTELQVSLDASSRAGVVALTESGTVAAVRKEAKRVAALNPVAGRTLALKDSDILVGSVTRQADGSYAFNANGTPYSAVRINKELSEAAGDKSVALFLGGFLGRETFNPGRASTSAFYEQEICLVIDRSHSMCFDLSGNDWKYPTGAPWNSISQEYPPYSPGSRWAALEVATQTFFSTVEEVCDEKPRVSLVTWSSNIKSDELPSKLKKYAPVSASIDVPLTTTYSTVQSAVQARGDIPMLGSTNLSAGMLEGEKVLTAADTKPYAKKAMIVMTDGQWNDGADPEVTAKAIADKGITIHCVTFLSSGGATTMERVAAIGKGRHFYASDAAGLRDTFEELARMLPVVTIQ